MLNTWWLCVILNITQYHSISHAFCQQTINGLLSLLIGRVICCDIQYHTISRWVSDNWINRDIVILISYKNNYYCPLNLFLPPYSQLLPLDKPPLVLFLRLSAKNRMLIWLWNLWNMAFLAFFSLLERLWLRNKLSAHLICRLSDKTCISKQVLIF